MPAHKKTRIKQNHIPVLLSTDIAGVVAHRPQLFYQLYQTLRAECGVIEGVELLPFRLSWRRMMRSLEKFDIPIVGIHGPVGWNHPDRSWLNKMFVSIFASITPSFHTTFHLTSHIQPRYLLFHEPDLDQPALYLQLKKFLEHKPTPTLLLENVYRPNSLSHCVHHAQKLATQTQTGIMIDLVHLVLEVMGIYDFYINYHHHLNSQNIDAHWLQMLVKMDWALQQISLAGLHLPVGTNRDSLPWDLLQDTHWRQLAVMIDKHRQKLMVITLENQHLATAVSLTEPQLTNLIQDKKMKISTLIRAGVL